MCKIMDEFIEKSFNEGYAEGYAEGKAVGKAEERLKILKNVMFNLKTSVTEAAKIMGIPEAEVEEYMASILELNVDYLIKDNAIN